MFQKKTLYFVVGMLLVLSLAIVGGCGNNQQTGQQDNQPAVEQNAPKNEEVAVNETEEIIKAAEAFLSSEASATINPEDVKKIVDEKDPGYQILSIRKPEHYAIGHIPGAINIPFEDMAKEESLAKLDPNKKVIVVCYTGHTASQTAMFLNQLGYRAMSMKFGMSGWTTDPKVYALNDGKVWDGKAPNYEVETTVNEAEAKFELPVIKNGAKESREAIIKATQAYFNAKREGSGNISAKDVKEKALNSTNYQIVSIRSPGDYANGHVPGAINIPFKTIAKKENLQKLDPGKKIIVYCYTGHTGSYATMLLNQLGYEAYNMKFGMASWTEDEKVLSINGKPMKGYEGKAPNYPTEAQ